MKIQILDKTVSSITFLAEGISNDVAGEMRRVMVSEIPTMAIEWVDFKKNDSVLQDEIIANRLGQVSLTYNKGSYNLPENCKCGGKGCSRCQIKLTLKKVGPCIVYSGDLKSKDKSVVPVFDKIPIVKLYENQEIEFLATAQLGLGKEHAKWQGAVVGYRNVPNFSINVKDEKEMEKYIKICPKHLIVKSKRKLIVTNPLECNMCMQCVEASNGNIKIEPLKDSFIFTVESASGLKPDEIVLLATEMIGKKLKDFAKGMKKLK